MKEKASFYIGHFQNEGPLTIRPFEDIKSLIKEKRKELKRKNIKPKIEAKAQKEEVQKELSDDELFLKAMEGVRPLENNKHIELKEHVKKSVAIKKRKEAQELEQGLKELIEIVKGNRPLPVEKIPEYIDGPSINLDKQLVRKLRNGEFAIQAYCELHGLRADEALQVCDGFMADSIMNNRRAVAFIHGRGKSSPGKPVLKELVKDFLNRGRFRRYVLAYSSAPSWDGGPGVTYVLLRKRPIKRLKK